MPRKTLVAIAAVGLLIALRFWVKQDGSSLTIRETRPLMGTVWSIEVVHHGKVDQARGALNRAFAEAARIESLMSEWRPDSPVSAINAAAGLHPVTVPEELRAILQRAIGYGNRSHGVFDITWRGMGSIWRLDAKFHVPSKESVERARRNVNYRALRLDGYEAFLEKAGMSLGLGGIAKGYAVDRAAEVLRASGFPDSLVAGAGDILASGSKNGDAWRLGIQDPRAERGELLGSLPVANAAISTSGDYERFRIVDGVRYHHIIDPRTGWPARESISVSVMAPTAEKSDVLATSIFVLGPEEGLALAAAEEVDVLVIDARGERHATGVFESLSGK